ncbi:hypothetical protein F5Y17DRAFT_457664 [Xylariaceae sp. FL0594]|nr:hypothetical protein F5Y17DRAFT_457664 [Xylariaceae sp. FL0594]
MTLFLDFDGTITAEDTVTHLANFALRFQSKQQEPEELETRSSGVSGTRGGSTTSTSTSEFPAPSPTSGPGSDQGSYINKNTTSSATSSSAVHTNKSHQPAQDDVIALSSRWDEVVRAYVSDYKSHVSSYAPPAPQRQCVADEVAFLRSQKHVETKSLARINECAIFRGITPDAFRDAGKELVRTGVVRLRPGFRDLVRRALGKGWKVNVVSVNWSAAFIEGACGFEKGEISVYANEVRGRDGAVLGPDIFGTSHGEGGGALSSSVTGEQDESRKLTNSCDKRDVVRAVLRNDAVPHDAPFFYFGDSTTDMECLLEATRGVVIADNEDSSLIRTLRRIGRKVPRVRDAEADDEVVWASDFDEVMAGPKFSLF